MGSLELAASDIRASLTRLSSIDTRGLSDSTTVMVSFRRCYWNGSGGQIGAWCGKNATQPEFEAASILNTGKIF